jgi:hypothetical protein
LHLEAESAAQRVHGLPEKDFWLCPLLGSCAQVLPG